MSVIAITIHGPIGVIDCPPAVTKQLHHTSATFSHDRKAWIIPATDVPSFSDWLRTQGHVVLIADPHARDPRLCPHGLLWGALLDKADHASVGGCNQCEWRMPDNNRLAAPHEPGAIPFTWAWWTDYQAAPT